MANKNRKSFFYVLQFNRRVIDGAERLMVTARIYRIKRNKTKFVGFIDYQSRLHDEHVLDYLKRRGHIRPSHKIERDFFLEAV